MTRDDDGLRSGFARTVLRSTAANIGDVPPEVTTLGIVAAVAADQKMALTHSARQMRRLADEMGELAAASTREAIDALSAWTLGLRRAFGGEAFALYERRVAHGGNATDADQYPDQWQSAACAAWLPGSCRSDEFDLRCTGTAHR